MTEFECRRCSYSTPFKCNLKTHLMKIQTCRSSDKNSPSAKQLLNELYPDEDKKYICKCGKSYSHQSTLSQHKKTCTNYSYIYTCLLNIKHELLKVCQEDVHMIHRFIDHTGIDYFLKESDNETLQALKTFKIDIDPNPKIRRPITPKTVEQRLFMNTLSRMSCAFEKRFKPDIKYLGCSINKLQYILEKQFGDGMNWNNYGTSIEKTKISTWQIDHIIPCNVFDFNNSIHRYACFHYKNLQPLWAYDNLGKGKKCESAKRDNYIQQFIELYIQ
jgi:hypothetical protein